MFCCCFIFLLHFSDFFQIISDYLSIYGIDLREISRTGRTLAADERSKLFFFDLSRDAAVATNFVGKIDLQSTPSSSHDIR